MNKLLALFVTLTAAAMASVAAWDRGGTGIDKGLLVAMSVVIVLAVHLIPALSRRPVAWAVWTGCLLCAIYGHLTFLTHASLRAGEARAQQSALTVGTERQIETAREALAEIKARPVATVAAQLAQESDRRVRAALRAEIAEAKRAQAIRDDLARLEAVSTGAHVKGSSDPVTASLATVTGWSESGVSVAIGLTFSFLLELIGALLWYEALKPKLREAHQLTSFEVAWNQVRRRNSVDSDSVATAKEAVTSGATDPVTAVTNAINAGEIKPTVADIRGYLNCSQGRAMTIRRIIVEGSEA